MYLHNVECGSDSVRHSKHCNWNIKCIFVLPVTTRVAITNVISVKIACNDKIRSSSFIIIIILFCRHRNRFSNAMSIGTTDSIIITHSIRKCGNCYQNKAVWMTPIGITFLSRTLLICMHWTVNGKRWRKRIQIRSVTSILLRSMNYSKLLTSTQYMWIPCMALKTKYTTKSLYQRWIRMWPETIEIITIK